MAAERCRDPRPAGFASGGRPRRDRERPRDVNGNVIAELGSKQNIDETDSRWTAAPSAETRTRSYYVSINRRLRHTLSDPETCRHQEYLETFPSASTRAGG